MISWRVRERARRREPRGLSPRPLLAGNDLTHFVLFTPPCVCCVGVYVAIFGKMLQDDETSAKLSGPAVLLQASRIHHERVIMRMLKKHNATGPVFKVMNR